MQCGACGTANRAGRRFCAQCGAPLTLLCPACGAANEPDDRFCGACGAALAADATAPPAVSERRLVSVLFADLVGFTTLSERRDPEEVRDLLSGYFDRCRALIERYGGVVEKFIGDAVMAVWGSPVAREDDAERAVRAALALTQAVTAMGDEVGMPGLRARAGVLTGSAAVDVGAEAEGMVLGDTVNTASRLQSVAAPGTVLVDDVTRRASEAAIAYEEAGIHELKGREQPVRAWQALRVVAGTGGARRAVGLEAPFAGRDAELNLIVDASDRCIREGRAQHVSVIGEPGIGKSRLAWEFFKYIDGIQELVLWHHGRCLSYGEGVAYWALAEMVRSRAGILEEEEPASAREKLRTVVEKYVGDERERRLVEPRLSHLLGLEHRSAADRADLFSGWRLFFERMAAAEPVVLVFEDLQWADSGLLEFIDYLLDWSADFPIFVLTFARPELLDRRPAAPTIRLAPLPGDAVDEMLAGLAPGLPDELRARIRHRAEGVPLYAVETVRMLLDRGLLAQEGSRYVLTGDVTDLDVPETLQALVAARLDVLEPGERALLQDASVLGQTFSADAVAALSARSREEVQRHLKALVAKQVLNWDDDPRSPERGQYGFVQALLRAVAYGTLARRDRKVRHLAAARHLEEAWGADATEIAEVLASHYLEAVGADPDSPDAPAIRASARETLAEAGRRAASLALGPEARRYFEQAAELTDDGVERAALLAEAGRAAGAAGDVEAGLERLRSAANLLEAAGQTALAARASASMAELLVDDQRLSEALPLLERAYAALADEEPGEALADVAARLGRVSYLQGDGHAALEHTDRALAIAEPLGLVEITAEALLARAIGCQLTGRTEEAIALLTHATALADRHGLTAPAVRGYHNAAYLRTCLGQFDVAAELYAASWQVAHRRGDRRWEQFAAAAQVTNLHHIGHWDEALARFEQSIAAGARAAYRECLYPIAFVADARGDSAALARIAALAAEEDLESLPQELQEGMQALGACVLRHEGRLEEALAAAQEIARPWGGFIGEAKMWLLVEAAEAARLLGRGDVLEALVAHIDSIAPALLSPWFAAQGHRLRGHLGRGDPLDEFARGATLLREISAPFFLAQVLLEHGEALQRADRRADAAPLLEEACAIFERLRARPWLERAQAAVPAVAA